MLFYFSAFVTHLIIMDTNIITSITSALMSAMPKTQLY